jgi:hypothetical protein
LLAPVEGNGFGFNLRQCLGDTSLDPGTLRGWNGFQPMAGDSDG